MNIPSLNVGNGGGVKSKLTWNLNLICNIHINVNFSMLDKLDPVLLKGFLLHILCSEDDY